MSFQRAAAWVLSGLGLALAILSCCHMAENYLVISHPSACAGVANSALCASEFRSARRQLSVLPQSGSAVTAQMVSSVASQVEAIVAAAAEIKGGNVRDDHFTNVVAADCTRQGKIALRYLWKVLGALEADAFAADVPYWLAAASTQVDNCVDGFESLAPNALNSPAWVHLKHVAQKAEETLEAAVGIANAAAVESADAPVHGRRMAVNPSAASAAGARWLEPGLYDELKALQATMNAGGAEGGAKGRMMRDDDDDDEEEDKKDEEKKKKKDEEKKKKKEEEKKKKDDEDKKDEDKKDEDKKKKKKKDDDDEDSNSGKSSGKKSSSGARPLSGPMVVSKSFKADVVVKGSIQDAVDAAPGGRRFVIYIPAGTYKEQVVIDTPDLILVGAGAGKTVITGSASVGGGSSTYDSATVGVDSDRFVAMGITFENTAGAENNQAVAFRATGDQSALFDCAFDGSQDTLYVDAGRQYYKNCWIGGSQDFIFGDAAVVIDAPHIQIHARPTGFGTLTASGRKSETPTGIVIRDATVQSDSDVSRPVYLGRPWKTCAFTLFVNTNLPAAIEKEGWLSWNEGGCMFLAEAGSKGAGAHSPRADWVEPGIISDASAYTAEKFAEVGSWLSWSG